MKSYRFLGAWLLLMAAAMPAFGQKYDYQLRVNDVGAMVLTAVIGSSVGAHRAIAHGVDAIAIVGLVLGPVCALALIVGAVRRRRRR